MIPFGCNSSDAGRWVRGEVEEGRARAALSFSKTARMAFSSLTGSTLKVSGSISTKTGVAPSRLITSAVAINVNGVVKMRSPGPTE